jgi:hypothetical protein
MGMMIYTSLNAGYFQKPTAVDFSLQAVARDTAYSWRLFHIMFRGTLIA